MQKKIEKLKGKGLINLTSYFIEFFLLSGVFKNFVNEGNLFKWIALNLPFITKELVLLAAPSFIILSTSIHLIYAKYINNEINKIEKDLDKVLQKDFVYEKKDINQKSSLLKEQNVTLMNKKHSMLNTMDKEESTLIEKEIDYDNLGEINDDIDKNKIMIKVYKK